MLRQDGSIKLTNRISERCQKAKNDFFVMTYLSMRPNALNPSTSVKLYSTIIIPIALYGCELWSNITSCDVLKLNCLQHFIVKTIKGFNIIIRSDIMQFVYNPGYIGNK